MWQCRARAKERRDRRRAEEREAAANLRLCHGFGCGSGGIVYPDSSEGGSSHRLINSFQPPPPPPITLPSAATHTFGGHYSTDIYHGCYGPTASSGPGSIYGGGGMNCHQQHWNGFIGGNNLDNEGEESTELLRKFNNQQQSIQQQPSSLHRYS
ncbi:hypothetical protein ACQ4LE_000661 [Meloidogyne hapla]